MEDPLRENIAGQKRVSHSVNWKVNVGYVALAVAVLYAAHLLLGGSDSETEQRDQELGPEAVEISMDGAENSGWSPKR